MAARRWCDGRRCEGVESADSIVVNPHKWLSVSFDCSLCYVRDPQHLVRVMSTNPSYLQTPVDREVGNYRDWGIPLGRRFRALKLWLTLRTQGVELMRARLRRDLENATRAHAADRAHPALALHNTRAASDRLRPPTSPPELPGKRSMHIRAAGRRR